MTDLPYFVQDLEAVRADFQRYADAVSADELQYFADQLYAGRVNGNFWKGDEDGLTCGCFIGAIVEFGGIEVDADGFTLYAFEDQRGVEGATHSSESPFQTFLFDISDGFPSPTNINYHTQPEARVLHGWCLEEVARKRAQTEAQ